MSTVGLFTDNNLSCEGIFGPVPHRGGDLPDVSPERTSQASGELHTGVHFGSRSGLLSNIPSLAVTLLFFCLHMMDGLDIHCTLHHISWNCQPLREFTFLRCSAQFFRYSFIFKESNYVHRNTALYWALWSKVLNACWKFWFSMQQLPCLCNMTASASLGWYWHRALLLFGNTL